MDYKDKIRRAETLGRKLLEYGEKMCSPDLCTCANVMLEDATTITYLLSRAEEAEARCALLDEARENANEACAKWEGMYHMALERAEKAERERNVAYEEIKELIEEEELPVEICREICENYDGICCERAVIGMWDTCRGFRPRGKRRNERGAVDR